MNRALQTYAKPTYKVSRPKQDNVVNLPTRNETMTFGEMSAEIDSRFYETLLSTKWSINNRKSLYSQALDLRDQMEFKIDAFFDDLEITSLLRKLSKEKVETIRREIISTYCSISESSFLYKILERKNTESSRRKIARSTSTITYNVYRIRKIVSTIALGAVVAATASAYAKGFIGISESPKIERKNTVSSIPPSTFGMEYTSFLKDKTYDISNPALAIYNFYIDCLKYSTCGFSDSQYRSFFRDGEITEFGKKSIGELVEQKVREIGDSIRVYAIKNTLSGREMYDKVRPFSKDTSRFAKK